MDKSMTEEKIVHYASQWSGLVCHADLDPATYRTVTRLVALGEIEEVRVGDHVRFYTPGSRRPEHWRNAA